MADSEHRQLQQSLTRLHTELAATPRVDPASSKLLREVLADIERVLKQTRTAATPEAGLAAAVRKVAAADQPVAAKKSRGPAGPLDGSAPRLEALAIEFETEHPTLAAGLRQLVDLLGRAGL